MTTNGVKSATDLSYATSNKKETSTKNTSFGELFQRNVNDSVDTHSVSDEAYKKQTKNASDSKTNAVSEDRNTKVTEKDSTKRIKKNSSPKQDTSNTSDVENQTVDENNSEITSGLDELKQVENNIKTQVLETLGITEEDLEKAMELLGITFFDLLNPNNLKELVLQINGETDISAALLNEDIMQSMNDLIQVIETLKESNQLIGLEEEIQNYMNQYADEVAVTEEMTTKEMSADEKSSFSITIEKEGITQEISVQKSTNSSSEYNSEDSSSKNQSSDVNVESQTNLFIQNLTNAQSDVLGFSEQVAYQRQLTEIANQVIEAVKVVISPEQTSMELNLNPENLGRVNLSIVSKDGVLTAHFVTQNEVAKEAIESQMQILRENLDNQGLKVDAIEVTVSNFGFEQSNQAATGEEQQQNKSNHKQVFLDEESLMNGNDKDVFNNETIEQGSSVNYTV